MPNTTVGSIMQLTTDTPETTAPMPRYTPVLVAAPTPPPPHAAADAAAEAGAGVKWETLPVPCKHGKLESCEVCELTAERDAAQADLRAEVAQHIEHIDALRVARAEAEDLIIALSAKTQDAMVDEARAEAAEAERNRLSAELAALREIASARGKAWLSDGCEETTCMATAWRCVELDRLASAIADRAAATGREINGGVQIDEWVDALIAFALATATPTPPAAEAVTGGEG